MVVKDWMGEKRGEGRWRIEVRKPKSERAKAKAANERHSGDGWVGEAHEAA
jgi:hypothetical protein